MGDYYVNKDGSKNKNINFTEQLFQSIDEIVSARISNLPYDQTIECEIIDASKADEWQYTVKFQASTFTAISERKDFVVGDIVYVQIPQTDFKQDKFIINKKQSTNIKPVKKLPFLNFVKGSNLFTESQQTQEKTLMTTSNGRETSASILNITSVDGESPIAGYTKLGIKVGIKTGIKNAMKSGQYGIRINLTGFQQDNSYLSAANALAVGSQERVTIQKTLEFSDMIISNPYNTFGYCNQEKVFDITNFVISRIQVEIWQDGKFIDINDTSVSDQRIYFNNFQLYFGYDISEFYNTDTKLFLYTKDGLLYNNSYNIKNLYIRYVKAINNKMDLNILTNQISLNVNSYNIYWETYNPNLADTSEYSSLKAFELTTSFIDNKKNVGKNILIDENFNILNAHVAMATARTRIKTAYVYSLYDKNLNKYYTSNIINFTNQAYLEGSEIIDLLTGFSVKPALENNDYNGKYFIYGQDSKSTDKIVSSSPHQLVLSYVPAGESGLTSGFQAGDIITWEYSSINTMLKPITEQDFTTSGFTISLDENNSLYKFTKVLTEADIDDAEHKFTLPYRIKDYYSNAYTDNTITCTFIRGIETYKTSIDILFGTSGSQGNEYNLDIKLEKQTNGVNKNYELVNAIYENGFYRLVVSLYNYNNKEINLINNNNYKITWEPLIYDQNNNIINILETQNNINFNFTISNFDINTVSSGIIKCIIKYNDNINDNAEILSGVYPLTYAINDDISINNTTIITYDITGKKPVYTKNPLVISSISTNNILTDCQWNIETKDLNNNDNWKPQIINQNELITPSIYHQSSNIPKYFLTCQVNNIYYWKQTIYMQQDKYPLGTYNPERLPMKINNSDYVNTTLVGRLQSNEIGQVSGIVMGSIKNKDTNTETLGLYAYHDGKQFVYIDENGYIILNGGENEDAETGGVQINGSLITDSSLVNIDLSGNLTTNVIIKDSLSLNTDYNNILTIDNNGNIVVSQLITGTISTANYAITANSANNYNSTTGNIYKNFQAIKTALDRLIPIEEERYQIQS